MTVTTHLHSIDEKGSPHLLEYRFVVVDIVNPNNDAGGGGERVWPSRCVVVRGRDIEDVLQALQLGQWGGTQTDQSYKDHRPNKLGRIMTHSLLTQQVLAPGCVPTVAFQCEECAIITRWKIQTVRSYTARVGSKTVSRFMHMCSMKT